MNHTWIRNTDPLCRPHRRCEKCALIEELQGDRRIYHRGGEDVALKYAHAKQPPCK